MMTKIKFKKTTVNNNYNMTRRRETATENEKNQTSKHNHTTKNFFSVLLKAKPEFRLAMFSGIAFQRGTQLTKKE